MTRLRGIFHFLSEAAGRGERTALVTLIGVTGSSARRVGAHMAVSESGASVGSFSGGCIEAAVVAEAQLAIASGRANRIRFGAGSRFLDLRLPCGGGIEVLITPKPPLDVLAEIERRIDARQSLRIALPFAGGMALPCHDAAIAAEDNVFIAIHDPELRIVILGHGEEPEALVRLGQAFGASFAVYSPDPALVEALQAQDVKAMRLITPARLPSFAADEHTAVVFLFHDHDWEMDLLAQALESEAFFIGAMGSSATDAARRAELARRGIPADMIARVVGPIGLIPSVKDPETLAVSILAQVVEQYSKRQFALE